VDVVQAERPEELAGFLAVLGELRPVGGHRVVEGQSAAFGQEVYEQRGERLAGREHPEQVVRPAPKRPVEDHAPVPHHAQLSGCQFRFRRRPWGRTRTGVQELTQGQKDEQRLVRGPLPVPLVLAQGSQACENGSGLVITHRTHTASLPRRDHSGPTMIQPLSG
jgi:hypothetical protein